MFGAWSLSYETVWEGVGSVAWLEEVFHWSQALRVQNPMPFSASSLCLVVVSQYLSSQILHQCLGLTAESLPSMMVMDLNPLQL